MQQRQDTHRARTSVVNQTEGGWLVSLGPPPPRTESCGFARLCGSQTDTQAQHNKILISGTIGAFRSRPPPLSRPVRSRAVRSIHVRTVTATEGHTTGINTWKCPMVGQTPPPPQMARFLLTSPAPTVSGTPSWSSEKSVGRGGGGRGCSKHQALLLWLLDRLPAPFAPQMAPKTRGHGGPSRREQPVLQVRGEPGAGVVRLPPPPDLPLRAWGR